MALADIQEKILKEAKLEAEKIIKEAEAERNKRLAVVERELAKQLKEQKDFWQKQAERELAQQEQLIALDNSRQVLTIKRQVLADLQKELLGKLLANKKILEKYLRKMFSELGKELLKAEKLLVSNKDLDLVKEIVKEANLKIEGQDWPSGRLELVSGKTKIDLTIAEQIKDYFRQNEKEIVRELFGE